jgi:hypothetical protein
MPDSRLLFTWLSLPFMITIVSVGLSSLLIYVVLADYKADLIYKDSKFRLERTGWFMAPCRLPELFVKKGLLEQKYKYTTNYCLGRRDIDSVKIIEGSNDSIRVVFYHHSDWKNLPNPIEVTAISK